MFYHLKGSFVEYQYQSKQAPWKVVLNFEIFLLMSAVQFKYISFEHFAEIDYSLWR